MALDLRIDGRERQQYAGRHRRKLVRKDRSAHLPESDADALVFRASAAQGIGDGTQRDAIVIQSEPGADDRLVGARRKGDTQPGAEVQTVGFHRIDDPLQIVAQAGVDGEIVPRPPLVL